MDTSRAVFVSLAAAIVFAAVARADEDEVDVGRRASGQLVAEVGFSVVTLEASIFPGISGFATGLVGFHSSELEDPAADFFVIHPESSVAAILVSADPGIQVYNGPHIMAPGDFAAFGLPVFDFHPVFNIFRGEPGVEYALHFILRDLAGHHADSEPFALTFAIPPSILCPADYNADGHVDPDDLADYIGCYFAASPCDRADFNADGRADPDDLSDFIGAFFGGAC